MLSTDAGACLATVRAINLSFSIHWGGESRSMACSSIHQPCPLPPVYFLNGWGGRARDDGIHRPFQIVLRLSHRSCVVAPHHLECIAYCAAEEILILLDSPPPPLRNFNILGIELETGAVVRGSTRRARR